MPGVMKNGEKKPKKRRSASPAGQRIQLQKREVGNRKREYRGRVAPSVLEGRERPDEISLEFLSLAGRRATSPGQREPPSAPSGVERRKVSVK